MSENYLTWDAYESMNQDEIPRWVDAHSVTCALCGELADERETISLWDDDHGPASETDWSDYPDGEAHPSCFEDAESGDKPKSSW